MAETFELDFVRGDKRTIQQFILTDVPGFGDPKRSDDDIARAMMDHIKSDRIHAIILVEQFGQMRFEDKHHNALTLLEQKFGDQLYNLMVLVLTHFPCPSQKPDGSLISDEDEMHTEANRLAEEANLKWRKEICERSSTARRMWGETKNMFFCVDSLSVHQKHEDLDDIIAKNSGDAEEEVLRRGEAKQMKWLKTWTSERLEDLKLHLSNRTKHKTLYWDAETPLQWTPPELKAEAEEDPEPKGCEHSYEVHTYYSPTYCEKCQSLLTGLRKQGYQCSSCQENLCCACYAAMPKVKTLDTADADL